MSSPSSSLPTAATHSPTTAARRPPLGLVTNAKKHKHSFIQLFTMSGILLLSLRSLGQKYRIHDLIDDTLSLKQEHDALSRRMESIKRGLYHLASSQPSILFTARLDALFQQGVSSRGGVNDTSLVDFRSGCLLN